MVVMSSFISFITRQCNGCLFLDLVVYIVVYLLSAHTRQAPHRASFSKEWLLVTRSAITHNKGNGRGKMAMHFGGLDGDNKEMYL